PTCAINPSPACVNDQLCVTPCDGVGPPDIHTYQWFDPNGMPAGNTPCIPAAIPGSYHAHVEGPNGTNPEDCFVTVNPLPIAVASAGADGGDICQAASGPSCFAPLDGTNSSNGTPHWTVVSEPSPNCVGFSGTGPDSFTPTVCFAPGCTGMATVRLTVTG